MVANSYRECILLLRETQKTTSDVTIDIDHTRTEDMMKIVMVTHTRGAIEEILGTNNGNFHSHLFTTNNK